MKGVAWYLEDYNLDKVPANPNNREILGESQPRCDTSFSYDTFDSSTTDTDEHLFSVLVGCCERVILLYYYRLSLA